MENSKLSKKEIISHLMQNLKALNPSATREQLKAQEAVLSSKSDLELQNLLLINCF